MCYIIWTSFQTLQPHRFLPFRPAFRQNSRFLSKQFHLLSKSSSVDDLFIHFKYIQEISLLICKTCSFSIFTALCHPGRISLSFSTPIYPKFSLKDNTFSYRSFSSVILYTSRKTRLSAPMSFAPQFFRKIGFWGRDRMIYRTVIGIGWRITTPPFCSWKLNWKFRGDINLSIIGY